MQLPDICARVSMIVIIVKSCFHTVSWWWEVSFIPRLRRAPLAWDHLVRLRSRTWLTLSRPFAPLSLQQHHPFSPECCRCWKAIRYWQKETYLKMSGCIFYFQLEPLVVWYPSEHQLMEYLLDKHVSRVSVTRCVNVEEQVAPHWNL